MVKNLLVFGNGFRTFTELQVRQTAHVLRPELRRAFVAFRRFQQFNCRLRVALTEFERAFDRRQPELVDERVFGVFLLQFARELLRFRRLAREREGQRGANSPWKRKTRSLIASYL